MNEPRRVQPVAIVRRKGVAIGCRWTPGHCVCRDGWVFWERGATADQMSRDALRLQKALLKK